MKIIKHITKRLSLFILAIILIGGPAFYLFSLNANSVKAAWLASLKLWRSGPALSAVEGFDDNWAIMKGNK